MDEIFSIARQVVATGNGGARSTLQAFETWHSHRPVYTEVKETAQGIVYTPAAGIRRR